MLTYPSTSGLQNANQIQFKESLQHTVNRGDC